MNYSPKPRGFTLIELLVVISIIALLSSIVMASLGTARTRGKIGAVKSSMSQLRSQMILYYNLNGNYGVINTSCANNLNLSGGFSDPGSTAIYNQIVANGATNIGCGSDQGGSSSDFLWSLYVNLPGGTTEWCIDVSGNSKVGTDSNGDGECN